MSGSEKAKQIISAGMLQTLGIAFVIWATSMAIEPILGDIKTALEESKSSKHEITKLNTQLPYIVESIGSLKLSLDRFNHEIEDIEDHMVEHEKMIPEYRVWKTKVDIHIEDCQAQLINCQDKLSRLP